MQIIHVPVKLEIRIAHRVEVPYRQLHHGVGLEDGLVAVALGLELGERQRRLAGVADLAPVPPRVRVLGEVLGREAADAHLVDVDAALLVREALLDHLHVDFEYFDRLFRVELGVVEADVDAGREGFVKVADSVGCQEEDAGIVL